MIQWKKSNIKQPENIVHQKLSLCLAPEVKTTIKEMHCIFDSAASEYKAKTGNIYLKFLAGGTVRANEELSLLSKQPFTLYGYTVHLSSMKK